jgi:MerR family transcriptional regulator, light-induced transcriptional regulator
MFDAFQQVIYPFLVKTGVLWSVSDLIPAQEHFASAIIRRKLIFAAEILPPPSREATFLLFLPEQEWHEIGLLFAHYILRSNGYKSIYLGQNVPFSNLLETCTRRKPTHLLSFFNQAKKKINLPEQYARLADQLPDVKITVCGRREVLMTLPLRANIQLCYTAMELNMLTK